jgi:transposase-like protein
MYKIYNGILSCDQSLHAYFGNTGFNSTCAECGLSYEKAGMFVNTSYEAVREWYQKGKELFEQSTEIKTRKWIAVDEKEITINGTTIFIWGAVDLDDEKVIYSYLDLIRKKQS